MKEKRERSRKEIRSGGKRRRKRRINYEAKAGEGQMGGKEIFNF